MEERQRVALKVRDIQLITLEMLDAFDAFCKRHGLTYCLCGGTLLGAVRHRGFIPWDDDLDVFMARPDYERLIEACRKEAIHDSMTFACPQNGLFMRPFSRIYYDRTSVWRKSYNEDAGGHVWMDILPVDGLPADPAEWPGIYSRRTRMDHYNMMTMWKIGTYDRKLDHITRPYYFLIGCGLRGRKKGAKYWCGRIEQLSTRYPFEASEQVGCISGGRYGAGEAMPREAFLQFTTVEFEGRTLPAMGCWHHYLSGIFGDYMKLPPEDRRYPHLDTVTMDIDDWHALCARHPELAAGHPEVRM